MERLRARAARDGNIVREENLADSKRLDWLFKNSHICIETMDSSEYPNTRELIDAAMQPNTKVSDEP